MKYRSDLNSRLWRYVGQRWCSKKLGSSVLMNMCMVSQPQQDCKTLHNQVSVWGGCRSEVLPCRQSSWTVGSQAQSCSLQVGRNSFPPALVAAPAGSRCTGWRCVGSPPWAGAGWGWPRCSAAKPRKRGWPSSAAGAHAWWQPVCGPQSWICACRPCRPTGGSVLAGEGLRGPWRARPPRIQRAPCRGQTPCCLEMRHMLCRSKPGMVRRHPWLFEERSPNGQKDGRKGRQEARGVGWERRPLSDVRGLLPQAPLICPQARAQGPHWPDLITMAHWPSQKAGWG